MVHVKKVVTAILVLSACLYGCSGTEQPPSPYTLAERAEQACDELKSNNTIKTWSELSDCYDRNVHSVYTQANYPNPDLVNMLFVKYRTIHNQMDSGKISISEGLKRKELILEEINMLIAGRTVLRYEA